MMISVLRLSNTKQLNTNSKKNYMKKKCNCKCDEFSIDSMICADCTQFLIAHIYLVPVPGAEYSTFGLFVPRRLLNL